MTNLFLHPLLRQNFNILTLRVYFEEEEFQKFGFWKIIGVPSFWCTVVL